ncbi:hypothetical protein DFH06DRAFT_1340559 [Mycena polygramma]|nr:hypothetical protein DFH06DRAFT_1340559 [Mycena polygramma]
MPAIRETPYSIVASALAKDIPVKPLAVITTVVAIPLIVHYASPVHLTKILEDTMSRVDVSCAEVFKAGHLSYSEVESFNSLQREVSAIKMETLNNSRSYWGSLWGFLKGRTFIVLLCIRKARDLETEITVKVGFLICTTEELVD